jgi:hypothetical protein
MAEFSRRDMLGAAAAGGMIAAAAGTEAGGETAVRTDPAAAGRSQAAVVCFRLGASRSSRTRLAGI